MATKSRQSIKPEDKQAFIQTVLERYDQDLEDRREWMDARLQRYAKLYGWLEAKHYPWPNASNQHIPMLMTQSQRTQDTLHNAVLKARPIMSAIAVNKGDAEKGKTIDELQDYQLFVEQQGEEKIGALIDSFVNDGRFVAFVPWVKEKRNAREVHKVPPVDPTIDPSVGQHQFLMTLFPDGFIRPDGENKFSIAIVDKNTQDLIESKAEFYQEDDQSFALITRQKVIFDGPCPIPKALEDIIVPSRCENLQPPSPSNPLGADHVIMVDWPQWDEIHRLYKSGYYDLLTEEDFEGMEERVEAEVGDRSADTVNDPEQHKILLDSLTGMQHGNSKTTSKIFTRITYFGRWQVEDDGFEEEIVARVILSPNKNTKALARMRYLEEEFPRQDLSRPRPFAVSPCFIPIPGQFYGLGLPELLEHLHDLTKTLVDQMIDKHTLSNTPWFLYRAASNVRPETIKMEPGMGYPVSNPQTDLNIPQFPQEDQTIALNLIALVQQWAEQKSMQGMLQMGGVPQGKSSALRTSTNMMAVMQQGDARPERILRRFFMGLSEIYQQMHELNKVYLPANKQYRIAGVTRQGADPYQVVQDPKQIGGLFQFDFKANTLNTSKGVQSQILSELMPMILNPMALQMGLTNAEKMYNLLRDYIVSIGQDENRYIQVPPNADVPKLTAEQAMGQMVQGIIPDGLPAEGAQNHMNALISFQQDPRFRPLLVTDPSFQLIYQTYLQKVQVLVQQEQMQAQMAQQFAQSMQRGGGQPGPQGQVDPMAGQMGMSQGPNQVNDESLPGAKGMM